MTFLSYTKWMGMEQRDDEWRVFLKGTLHEVTVYRGTQGAAYTVFGALPEIIGMVINNVGYESKERLSRTLMGDGKRSGPILVDPNDDWIGPLGDGDNVSAEETCSRARVIFCEILAAAGFVLQAIAEAAE